MLTENVRSKTTPATRKPNLEQMSLRSNFHDSGTHRRKVRRARHCVCRYCKRKTAGCWGMDGFRSTWARFYNPSWIKQTITPVYGRDRSPTWCQKVPWIDVPQNEIKLWNEIYMRGVWPYLRGGFQRSELNNVVITWQDHSHGPNVIKKKHGVRERSFIWSDLDGDDVSEYQ